MRAIDYSSTDSMTRGAEMALKAAGIKDDRKKMEMLALFRQAQLQHLQLTDELAKNRDEREAAKAKRAAEAAKTAKELHELEKEKKMIEMEEANAAKQARQNALLRRKLKPNPDVGYSLSLPDVYQPAPEGLESREISIPEMARNLAEAATIEGKYGNAKDLLKMAQDRNLGDRAYKIGKELSYKKGDFIYRKKLVGYDENGREIWEDISRAPRYKPEGVNVNLPRERFDIQLRMKAGELKDVIVEDPTDKKVFDKYQGQYNASAINNVVTYWEPVKRSGGKHIPFTRDKKWGEEVSGGATFLRLPAEAIEVGWTPKKIQEYAENKRMTVKEVLQELEILPK